MPLNSASPKLFRFLILTWRQVKKNRLAYSENIGHFITCWHIPTFIINFYLTPSGEWLNPRRRYSPTVCARPCPIAPDRIRATVNAMSPDARRVEFRANR